MREVAALYLEHRFDVLGSGWVQNRYDMVCRGLEGHRYAMHRPSNADRDGTWLCGRVNPANLPESRRIWSLVHVGYVPIDWHRDVKSGFRWSERTWYRDIRFGHAAGADVKVPWELARLQHGPVLAVAFALASQGEPGFAPAATYQAEFRNEVLDFLSVNPPGSGVNWSCTMEVALRAANVLLGYDLFRAFGATFDTEFDACFARSVFEHGRHIVENLEWSPEFRGNHYLANIVGLLFVAAYLPLTKETNAWLELAIRELESETQLQFGEDGTNFEGSTCYHGFAAELVLYGTALALTLPASGRAGESASQRLPPAHFTRLSSMAEFIRDITKPNGRIVQVGDNDSGRFVKLSPLRSTHSVAAARSTYANLESYAELPDDAPYWEERHLDHRPIAAAIGALLGREDLTRLGERDQLEAWLVEALAAGNPSPAPAPRAARPRCAAAHVRIGSAALYEQAIGELSALPATWKRCTWIELPRSVLAALDAAAYPEFGLYIWRAPELFLSVRCGPVGQRGRGGHAHNDQLAIELNVAGADWIADPGSYLYTALPARRNAYRSVVAHAAPRIEGREPGTLDDALFVLPESCRAECLYFGELGFLGRHFGYGAPLYRAVRWQPAGIRIMDFLDGTATARRGSLRLEDGLTPGAVPFSPGYGVVVRTTPTSPIDVDVAGLADGKA